MAIMFLLNLEYGVEVTFPDKLKHFNLFSISQVEEILKFKLVDEYF